MKNTCLMGGHGNRMEWENQRLRREDHSLGSSDTG